MIFVRRIFQICAVSIATLCQPAVAGYLDDPEYGITVNEGTTVCPDLAEFEKFFCNGKTNCFSATRTCINFDDVVRLKKKNVGKLVKSKGGLQAREIFSEEGIKFYVRPQDTKREPGESPVAQRERQAVRDQNARDEQYRRDAQARQARQMCEAQKQTCRALCPAPAASWRGDNSARDSCIFSCDDIRCN